MRNVNSLLKRMNNGPGRNSSGSVFFLLSLFSKFRSISKRFLVLGLASVLLAAQACPQTWQRLGPQGGTVISLAVGADGTVYLGTPDGHVFASIDRGERWTLRGRVGDRLDGVVQRIVLDEPRSSDKVTQRLVAAVRFQDPSFGGGIFESVDGARHWELTALKGEAVRALEHSNSDRRVWVAGTLSGVFRSTDDAHTWQKISPANDRELQNIDSLAIDPGDPQIIYVGTYHLPWKTVDGGKTWNSIATGMIDDSDVMSLRVDSQNPQRIFSSACSGIYRSEDAGATWTKLQGIPYASRRTQQIAQDPADPAILYAATTEGLWQTTDHGESWKRIAPQASNVNTVLAMPYRDGSRRLLAGTETYGVLRSDDAAETFAPSNQGFSHRVMSSIAADPRDPAHLLARLEVFPQRLLETRDAGESWSDLSGEIPHKTIAELYGGLSGWWAAPSEGGLARFDATKGTWALVPFRDMAPRIPAAAKKRRPAAPAKTRLVSPHVVSLVELSDGLLVASDDGLWRKSAQATEFRRIQDRTIPASFAFLAAGPFNRLLAIAKNGLWTSNSSAQQWELLPTPQAGRLLWILERQENGRPVQYLGTQNGVFRAAQDGRWQILANGLPAIASEPPPFLGSRALIAMENGGIYRSGDSGVTWERVDSEDEKGRATRVFAIGGNEFRVASQAEGLLRYTESEDGRP
jgi:photosystem II stability/assembly factor-like uncharacterized protein